MELEIGGISSESLAEEYETPLYVYDRSIIEDRIGKILDGFKNTDFELSYAVKANPNPEVVKAIVDEGVGLDCASETELRLALKLTEPENIIYTAPFPPEEELNFAAEKGVTVNLDATYLLDELDTVPERVSFRIDPGIGKGDFGLVLGGGSKFGIPEEEAVEAYRKAKDLGVESFGIHMMTGSGILEPEYFEKVTGKLMDIAARISEETVIEFEFVDIGGGLGVPYRPDQEPLDIEETAERVSEVFESRVAKNDIGQPKLKMEPGRFIVAESGYILTRVNGVKEKDGKTFVGVDTGMHHFLRPMLYDAYHEIKVANDLQREVDEEKDVVGLVCENTDKLAEEREMPNVEKEDLLAVEDVGAYGFAMASNWNTRPKPAEVMIEEEESRIIREKQEWQDIFHGTEFQR